MQNSYCKISIGYLLFLFAILLIAGYTPTNDGEGYIELALMSLKDGMPYPSSSSISGQPFVWNIGQICIIELSLWLFHSVYPVLIANCLLKALTAYTAALIARQLFNHRTGLLTLVLYIVYPNNWGDCTMLLTEIPSTALALAALYIILSRKGWKMWLIAGLLFATSNWIRPISPIYIGTAFICQIMFKRGSVLKHYACLMAAYVSLAVFIGFGSWLRTGYFLYQSDTLWFNMAEATYETSTKPHYNTEMFPKGTIRYIEDMEHRTAPECSAIWKKRCLEWLKTHKADYLKKVPGRLFWMYFSDTDNIPAFLANKQHAENNYVTLPYRHIVYSIPSLSKIQYLALITWAFYIMLLLAYVCGLCRMAVHRQWQQALLIATIVIGGSLAIVLATHGETRFKTPFMPFIIMTAAYFLPSKVKNPSHLWRKK